MAQVYEMDTHLTRTLVVAGFTSMLLFLFLTVVCKFEIIEKKIKNLLNINIKLRVLINF